MTNENVIKKFIQKENATSSTGAVKSHNNYLYSYSLKIAKNLGDIIIAYPASAKYSRYYSNTTSKHVSLMLSVFKDLNLVYYTVSTEKELEEIIKHPIL